MSQQGLDLYDNLDPEVAIEHAEALAEASERGKWPRRLLELTDLLEAHLERTAHRKPAPRALAEQLVSELANYLGGRPVYLPRGDALARALRDRRIYRDAGRIDFEALAEREGVCLQQVYKIVATMRALDRKRRQQTLPLDGGFSTTRSTERPAL